MSDNIQTEIQAMGLTAPHITPADIEANIASEHYFTAAEGVLPNVGEMVDRFLGWKLPSDFAPDAGIVFTPPSKQALSPTGTNLFHAGQAKEMFEYAVGGADVPQALHLLTFCVLVLRNSFTVTGESACASPENFDADLGRKIARQNAVNNVWPLMGYELKCRLAREAAAPENFQDRVRAEAVELNDRIKKLSAFLPTDKFSSLPFDEQRRLIAQLDAMLDYGACLDKRIAAFGVTA